MYLLQMDTIYFYCGSAGVHQNGVAIILKETIVGCINNFVSISNRMMLLQLSGQPVNININQVYAPTADKEY